MHDRNASIARRRAGIELTLCSSRHHRIDIRKTHENHQCDNLSMGNVRNSSIVFHMNVEAVLLEVLSYHLSGLDHTVLLGQVSLGEGL